MTATQTTNTTEAMMNAHENGNPLAEEIMEQVEGTRINPDWLDFPAMLTAETDDEGHLYVTDMNNVIRYYLGENEVIIAPKQQEREKIIDESERQMSLESVMYELVHGSGSPFAAPSSPSL